MNKETFVLSFQEFNGNAEELIQAAIKLCDVVDLALNSNHVRTVTKKSERGGQGNERLVRHYVSIGIVDNSIREGREARYGFRHLLQYVTARRLLKHGFSLGKIAQYTSSITTSKLIKALLSESQQGEAEIVLAAYKSP